MPYDQVWRTGTNELSVHGVFRTTRQFFDKIHNNFVDKFKIKVMCFHESMFLRILYYKNNKKLYFPTINS